MRDHKGLSAIIKLDASALEALFPEGSEARVQLQLSCLQQAASKYIKGSLDDDAKHYLLGLVKQEQKAAKEEINKTLHEHFGFDPLSFYGQSVQFNSEALNVIKHRARAAATEVADKVVKDEMDRIVQDQAIQNLVADRAAVVVGQFLRTSSVAAANAEIVARMQEATTALNEVNAAIRNNKDLTAG